MIEFVPEDDPQAQSLRDRTGGSTTLTIAYISRPAWAGTSRFLNAEPVSRTGRTLYFDASTHEIVATCSLSVVRFQLH